MFTAKDFLRSSDYGTLPENLLADPDRLSLEFLEIATDPNQLYADRLKALRILHIHARDLGVSNSPNLARCLMIAFEREFPPETLNDIATAERTGHSHHYSLLVFRCGVTLARIAGDHAQDLIDSVRQVFKGTWREASLNSLLAMIQRQRERPDL